MSIPPDKQGHLVAGALIASLAINIGLSCDAPFLWTVVVAGMIAALAGWEKEIRDKKDPAHHTVDVWDFVATAVGGVLVCLTASIAHSIRGWFLIVLCVLGLAGCGSVRLPSSSAVVGHALEAEESPRTRSLEDQRTALLRLRDDLRDKLDAADLRLKQSDRDIEAERIKSHQQLCTWIAGLMFVAAVVASVAAVMLPIPRKLTLGIAVTCILLGCGALTLKALLPYLAIIAGVVFGVIGIAALIILAPRLHALHELAKEGTPYKDLDKLSNRARKGLRAASKFAKASPAALPIIQPFFTKGDGA